MKKIILIGAGGQAKSCIDVIHLTKNYKIVGFIDIKKKKKILNYKVLGIKYTKNAKILDGTIIHHNTVINFDAKIGFNSIINTSAIIEHGAKIGNNCHVSTRAVINGDVVVQENTFIGSGTVIREGVKIGKNCFIGMGQIVTKDIPNNSVIK